MIDNAKDGIIDDMQTLMLDDVGAGVHIGYSSVIGRRKEQQDAIKVDSFYTYAEDGKAIAVLCDGMGGLTGGAKASALCSNIVYDTFHSGTQFPSVPAFYKAVIQEADAGVRSLKADNGAQLLGAGTTMVSVVIDNGKLYWASVGDSRLYIIRGTEMLCVTKDHNYLMLLNEKVKRGEISQAEANNHPKKEALVSYIGIGGVRYVDMNVRDFQLALGDYIVLCSDGLYRSMTDSEIYQIVTAGGTETQKAAEALTCAALNKNLKHQDNTSVVVINYQSLG